MENRDYDKKILDIMYEHDKLFRYNFLVYTIRLERMMDNAILIHFCKRGKTSEFMDTILGNRGFGFDLKKQIFEIIIEKHHPEIKEKYTTEMNWFPKINSNRNTLAHSLMDDSKEAIDHFKKNNYIRYIRYDKGSLKHEDFTDAKTKKTIKMFDGMMNMMNELVEKLKKSDEQASE